VSLFQSAFLSRARALLAWGEDRGTVNRVVRALADRFNTSFARIAPLEPETPPYDDPSITDVPAEHT
jgi:hypothetical protein